MITELRIDNFAIIQHLELEPSPGLVIFTGETGAGKSIILDAIVALLGGRADATLIRSGSERALVEAVFSLPETSRAAINEILEREDLLDDPNYLTLGRELRREGRSTARVNGRSVNTSLLKELGSYLIDIHGQSEHLSLLDVRQHLNLLDRFANAEAGLAAYRQTFQQLTLLRRELNALRQAEQESSRRIELLTFQAQEIEDANLRPGEEEELRQERDRLANAESLSNLGRQAAVLIDEGSPETPSISDLLGQVTQALNALSRIDPQQTRLATQAESVAETLSDVSLELQDYLESLEFNPRRLEQLEERIELIHSLTRKYGGQVETALQHAAEARQKLEEITHSAERIAELEADEKSLLARLGEQGLALSAQRREAAGRLSSGIEIELDDLSMASARFQVDFRHQPDPDGIEVEGERIAILADGFDQVEFLIAPNPGEGFKPLVKIASGGETSRLMLALKNVLARADYVPTLIFDEIDQGIGGRVGVVVGEKLWSLARQHQVFCVTHLPQLAAFGDQHYRVRKLVQEGRTLTDVERMDDSTRLNELAQMLGGINEANLGAAFEALQTAGQYANKK